MATGLWVVGSNPEEVTIDLTIDDDVIIEKEVIYICDSDEE